METRSLGTKAITVVRCHQDQRKPCPMSTRISLILSATAALMLAFPAGGGCLGLSYLGPASVPSPVPLAWERFGVAREDARAGTSLGAGMRDFRRHQRGRNSAIRLLNKALHPFTMERFTGEQIPAPIVPDRRDVVTRRLQLKVNSDGSCAHATPLRPLRCRAFAPVRAFEKALPRLSAPPTPGSSGVPALSPRTVPVPISVLDETSVPQPDPNMR